LQRLKSQRSGAHTLEQLLRRPEVTYASLPGRNPGLSPEVATQVEIEVKYSGYIRRQQDEVCRLQTSEDRRIPSEMNYRLLGSLSTEAKLKLEAIRPTTIGQAARISGITPADISALMVALKK
jgi:tRNA uridine 5-carboxymethylaminomethyl modification enzyme